MKAESSTPSTDVQPCADGGLLLGERLAMRQVQGRWQAELYILSWMLKIVQLVEPSWAPMEISCISEASPDCVQPIELPVDLRVADSTERSPDRDHTARKGLEGRDGFVITNLPL